MLDDLYQDNPEDIQPEEYNRDYQFADGTIAPSEQLDAFIREFAIDKEEKGAADEPTPEELAELANEHPEDEEEISTLTARNTAQFIVASTDELASAGLAYLSKEKQDDFRAGREQRKNLENLFTKYCKEKAVEIKIEWQILFCILSLYGSKIPYALDRRAINKERAEIEGMKKDLEKQRLAIERKLDELETERKTLRSIRDSYKKNNAKEKTDGAEQ